MLNLPVTWNREFIYDKYVRSDPNNLDLTGMIEFLHDRERNEGIKSVVKTVGHAGGVLTVRRVFVELDHAMAEYARGGDSNVVLFDPTWGTNRSGLKLAMFVTIGSSGQSVVLAFVLIKYEDQFDIEWAFRCFHWAFKRRPEVLLTDDAASIAAVSSSFCTGCLMD